MSFFSTETVKAGRGGTKVHLRFESHPTTVCGQGLGTRGGRVSPLFRVSGEVTCEKCIGWQDPEVAMAASLHS